MFRKIVKKNLLFLVLVFLYLIIALCRINWLGIQFDEVLFANIAWGVIDNSFISLRLWKIPIMTMQYMGALKAYLYYFIFHIFGASVFTLRVPVIILTIFILFFIYKSILYFFNKKIALLTLLLLIINPSFVSLMTFDVGPNVIEFFLKSFFFLLITYFLKTKNRIYLLLAFGCMFLGVYNKLNFIWIVGSILFLFLIGNKKILKKIYKYWLFLLLPFIFFISFFTKYNYWSEIKLNNLFPRLIFIFNSVGELVKGNIFFNYLGINSVNWFQNLIWIVWCLIILFAFIRNILNKNKDKKYFFVLFFVLLMSLQMVITQSAGAPWHIFMIEPFLTLLFVFSCSFLPIKKVVVGIMIIYGLWNNYQWFFGIKKNPTNIMWSPAISDLCVYTKSEDNHFINLNWGLHNQLIMFDPVKGKYEEIWAQILEKWGNKITEEEKQKIINDKNIRYIAYTKEDVKKILPSSRDEWFNYAKSLNKNIYVEKEFFDRNGLVIAVYRIE